MDVTERLRTLLRPCAWVRDPATALRLVPELAVDLPSPVDMVAAEGASDRAIAVRCVEPLMEPVATVVLQLGEASLDGKAREELHRAGPDRVLADPLVALVAELLSQSSGPGLDAQGVPALSVAWLASRMLTGASPELREQRPDLFARVGRMVARLSDQPSAKRGAVLADIAWGLRGRLAAAVSVAQSGGWSVQAGGLFRRVMADSLVLTFPRGTLDENIPFGVLAVILGLPLEESLAGSIERAAATVIPALVDRRARGKATPTDDALASAFSGDLAAAPNARGVLFDLWSGPLLIASLPDLADAKLLIKAGINKDVAAALMRREVVRAVAASWRDLVTALLSWDVMSSVVSRMVPIRQDKGRWVCGLGRLGPSARWDLLVPRPLFPPARATVVAVGLGAARARAAKVAAERGRALIAGAADGAWARLVAEHPAGLYSVVGERGLGVFSDPLAALAFARKARQALAGPGRIPVGFLGDPVELPPGVTAPVGISTGEIRGGTDGLAVWLDGPAVAEAVALVGLGEPNIAQEADPSAIRSAAVGADGLYSRGVVLSAGALASLVQAARDVGLPVHARGRGGAVAGVGEPFAFYPIDTWLEPEEGTVAAAVALGGPEGARELIFQPKSAFSALHDADAELARKSASRPAARPAPAAQGAFGSFSFDAPAADPFNAGAPSAGDPFAAEHPPAPAPAPAPRPAPAPARAPAPPPAPAPRPAAAAAATFAAEPDWLSGVQLGGEAEEDLGDPFADLDTDKGRAAAASGRSGAVARESTPTLAPMTQAAEQAGLEFFDPLPDAGDLFADAYDGPSVSIEEDGWGGESELAAAPSAAQAGFAFAGGPEIPEGPETPVPIQDAPDDDAWARDYLTGFDLQEGGGEEAEEDMFGPSAGPAAGPVVRTENILELDATRGEGFGFRSAPAARAPEPDADVNDMLTEDSGAALFEADPGVAGFAFLDEDEAADELATSQVPPAAPLELPADNLPGSPPTWGDVGTSPGVGGPDALELGALFESVDAGEKPSWGAFPDPDSSQAIFPADEGEDELGAEDEEDAFEDGPSASDGTGGLSFDDFPLVGADQEALEDWETGSFDIAEPEETPSVPSAPPLRDASPRARPFAPPREAPPPRLAGAPEAPRAHTSRAVAPTTPAPAPPPPRSAAPAPAMPDFGYLFMGYVLYEERGEAVFGRPYGRLLVDAHAYPASGGLEASYARFLQDKLREGFVPRTDMTRPYAADQPGQKLDLSLLARAYRAMV